MTLEATTDLVIGQWFDSPRLRAAIDAPVDVANEDVVPAFDRITLMREIDSAEGVWLDYLGVRVGIRRPTQRDPSMDDRLGFDMAGEPFDQAPFRGDVISDAVYPLNDEMFRRFIKARAILDLGDGTFQTFSKAVRTIDPGAAVQDQRNMTVRVVTSLSTFLELADEVGALPRTAGVLIALRRPPALRLRLGRATAGRWLADTGELMVDTQAKKILAGGIWASADAADRVDPEDVGISRTEGWRLAYEQIGSGFEPEREVVNQKFREWDGFTVDVARQGILFWDADIDYVRYAFVAKGEHIYVANLANGPNTGNATDPDDSGQQVWRLY